MFPVFLHTPGKFRKRACKLLSFLDVSGEARFSVNWPETDYETTQQASAYGAFLFRTHFGNKRSNILQPTLLLLRVCRKDPLRHYKL